MDKNKNDIHERVLLASLQRNIDFLKFAEAKNGVLLTLSSGWTLAIINFLYNTKVAHPLREALQFSLLFCLLSIGVSLISFFPKTRSLTGRGNLLYFGYIASLSTEQVTEQFKSYLNSVDKYQHRYLTDIKDQILITAQITKFKLLIFKYGVVCMTIPTALLFIVSVSEFFGS